MTKEKREILKMLLEIKEKNLEGVQEIREFIQTINKQKKRETL